MRQSAKYAAIAYSRFSDMPNQTLSVPENHKHLSLYTVTWLHCKRISCRQCCNNKVILGMQTQICIITQIPYCLFES